jgi:hypothetical protein
MLSLSRFHDRQQVVNCVGRGRIPSRDQVNGGLFASHYFNLNPSLETIQDVVDVKFFLSKLQNPIK